MQHLSSLNDLCIYIAPNYPWDKINKHLRFKFQRLDENTFEIQYREFLKFIFLRSKYGKGFIPVSHDIDEFWHEFILQTRAYEELCKALPGKHFIHHNTISFGEHATEQSREEIIQNLLDWIPNYIDHFGNFTEETAKYWMLINFLQEELAMNLEEINGLTEKP